MTDLSLLTIAEVAALLRVSKMTVYRLAKEGDLDSMKVGHGIRIGRDSVERYIMTSSNGMLSLSTFSDEIMTTRKPPADGKEPLPHTVECVRDDDGHETHTCLLCGYVGSTPPPFPCPGTLAAVTP